MNLHDALPDRICAEHARHLSLPAAYAGLAFMACLQEAIRTPELIEQFDRLYGADLSQRHSPIVRMVDQATAKREDDMRAFVRFVHDGVYLRLPDEAIHSVRAAAISPRAGGDQT